MKIEIPLNAIAIAVDYKGDAQHITAVCLNAQNDIVIPTMQMNANPVSTRFGRWQNNSLLMVKRNARNFISDKTRTAARIWYISKDLRFIDIWQKGDGVVEPLEIDYVEEVKNADTASV
ncbi:hypothetical protein DEEACLCL_00070 [Salmonella phage CRW-SP2]|nr:hypothetical protein DEEACLCL_00070 [Salmonella phage CRW-SP2]